MWFDRFMIPYIILEPRFTWSKSRSCIYKARKPIWRNLCVEEINDRCNKDTRSLSYSKTLHVQIWFIQVFGHIHCFKVVWLLYTQLRATHFGIGTIKSVAHMLCINKLWDTISVSDSCARHVYAASGCKPSKSWPRNSSPNHEFC